MIRHMSALVALAALSLSAVACASPVESEAEVAETTDDLVSASAHFETFEGIDGDHYFRLVAANGATVLRSEGYTTLSDAKSGIAAVLEHGTDARNYAVLEAVDTSGWYFNLRAPNAEIIGTSQLYATKSNADRGLRTVRSLIRVVRQEARDGYEVIEQTSDRVEVGPFAE